MQAPDDLRRAVRNDARQFVADGDMLIPAPIVHERYTSGDRGLQHILLPPLGDLGRELLAALFQRPLVFRRFVFLLERQFDQLLLRLDDLQLGRGERGVEPRLRVLLREVVLGRGFVVGGGDHGFGQKQRIPLQRAAAVIEILQQQRTLPFEFGVILTVLGDLFAQKLFFAGDIVRRKVVAVVAAAALEVGEGGLQLPERIFPVEPRTGCEGGGRKRVGGTQMRREALHVLPFRGVAQHGDELSPFDALTVADAERVDQSVVARHQIGGRIDGRDDRRSLDRIGVLDKIAADGDSCKNQKHDRDSPSHHP